MVRLMEGEQECNNRTQTKEARVRQDKAPVPSLRSCRLKALSAHRFLRLRHGAMQTELAPCKT